MSLGSRRETESEEWMTDLRFTKGLHLLLERREGVDGRVSNHRDHRPAIQETELVVSSEKEAANRLEMRLTS